MSWPLLITTGLALAVAECALPPASDYQAYVVFLEAAREFCAVA